jgi:outer membrane protein OmpA-like peptidoglycan-associated protein
MAPLSQRSLLPAEIQDMAASILDNLRQLINQGAVSSIAERLGENPQNVQRGLSAGSTSILGGLANKADNPVAMSQVFDLISKPGTGAGALADDVALAREGQPPTELANLSSRFLSDLFGERASLVNGVVSEASGLSGQSTASIMRFAAPLVLGFLGRHVRSAGLDVRSFTRLLGDAKDDIMRAAPPGLASALGVERPRASMPEREIVREREAAFESDRREASGFPAQREPVPETRSGGRWLWPTLAVLAIIALIWGARSRSHRMPNIDTTSVAGGEVAPAIAPPSSPTTGAAPLAGATSVSLPNGTTLNVAPGGFESRVVGFMTDSSMHGDTTWFAFDRLNFENNSSTLSAQSQPQIDNVSKILQAYPNTHVKIGGFTDNKGSAAANLKLSSERANAVRAALIKDGVSASQITARGFGAQHPIADNSTEEGRAQNRRIGLLLVKT